MITTDTHVYFYRGYLSNWRICDIQDATEGLQFRNSEQLFMFCKATFFRDGFTAIRIHKEGRDPSIAKTLGREIKPYDDKAWSCVRLGYMVYVNWLKYSQNADLKQRLLDTGNRTLVEASPVDNIWGCGLAEDNPLIRDQANWTGINLLGQALMTVRGMI